MKIKDVINNNKIYNLGGNGRSNAWEDNFDEYDYIFNTTSNIEDNIASDSKSVKVNTDSKINNDINLTIYLLNYLKSSEYYKLCLLGQTTFEFTFDTSDTIDNYLFGINKVSFNFSKKSDDELLLPSYLNLGELLKKITINELKVYVDVKFLQMKKVNWKTSSFNDSETTLIVDSDVNKDYSKKLYLNLDFKNYIFYEDLSCYIWEREKHIINDKFNLDFYNNLPGDKSELLIQFNLFSKDDLETFKDVYSSHLLVLCNLKNSSWIKDLSNLLSEIKKGQGNKYLSLSKSISLYESEDFFNINVGKLNKNILKLYDYFDDIYCM